LTAIPLELDVFVPAELQSLTVLAVRGPEAVLVLVGLVVHGSRVEGTVVALLQLDRVYSAFLGYTEQLLALVHAALVIVPHLSDDERLARVVDLYPIDPETPPDLHGAPDSE